MHSHINIESVDNKRTMTLPEGQSIDIEEQNPLFGDVEMMSYPVSFPFDYNRGVFKNIDDRDSDLRAQDVEGGQFRIMVDGLPFRTTVLHVQEDEVLKDRIAVNFDSRTKTFKDMLNNLKCREVPVTEDIPIGEKIGPVTATFRYRPKLDIWFSVYPTEHSNKTEEEAPTINGEWATAEGVFTPPALGFSYPGICALSPIAIKAIPVKEITYKQPDVTVSVPTAPIMSFINTSKPYPQAKYCNSRVCYAHHKYDSENKETSDEIVTVDEKSKSANGPQDFGPYWVLDADRPASGICFYVAYFLECLFKHLGVAYDISALTNIEDFNYLAFFTTACKFDERPAPAFGTEGNILPAEGNINEWLKIRGCGGQIVFDKNGVTSSTKVTSKEINGVTYKRGDKWTGEGSDSGSHITGMESSIEIKDFHAEARVDLMYANSENFPDAMVTEVIESLESTFGCRFDYDPEVNMVTVHLLRDVFRSQQPPIHLNARTHSMYKMTEKITGVRIKYADESDADEQRQNIREGKRDYNTDYDYIDYPDNRTVIKHYRDVVKKIDATDMNVYVDPTTGNAIRIKIDKDATSAKDAKPVAFEVGQFKGIEVGDCSQQAEDDDTIQEIESSFQPIIVNDVNYKNGGSTDPLYQPILSPFIDEDMEREFMTFKQSNSITIEDTEVFLVYQMQLAESYDPSNSDDGQSPLMSHDWGLAIGILRTGDGGAGVENYDHDYDGFQNWRWRDIADNYCISSDTMDQTGLWLGKTDKANTFSLKIRAWKPFLYYIDAEEKQHFTHDMSLEGQPVAIGSAYTWLLPCTDDERDAQGHITRRIRSRGWADVFMSEYIHFLLNRHKYRWSGEVEIAQLADIPHHWRDFYEIDGKICLIDKVKYSVDNEKGIGEVEMDIYSI